MWNKIRDNAGIVTAIAGLGTMIILWITLVTASNQLEIYQLDKFQEEWRDRIAPVRHKVDTYGNPIPIEFFDHAKHPKEAADIGHVGDFFDVLGRKVRKGYISAEDACTTMEAGFWAERYWSQYRPAVNDIREKQYPAFYSDFEKFAQVCKKYRRN